MANRTIKDAKTVHGTNPQYLIEKIIRTRIYESRYWKEECFALNAELIVDKGIELRFIGGIYGGNIKPTPFMCLLLKLLQIQPYKDIVIEFIRQEDFKYVRALGAFYLRLTGTSLETWKYLEPLYNDYRKLRRMDRMGNFSIMHMDEFIDTLLREDRVFDVILPRISKRSVHEEAGDLEPRISVLEEDINNAESEEEEVQRETEREMDKRRAYSPKRQRSKSPKRTSRSRSRSPGYKKSRSHSDKRKRDRSDSVDRRRRSRSRSPSKPYI
ncbi:pre-mRNA-splicing factor 38A-like protein [Leptotrombidium deliense]|uniref:Pre-mRNA-splicing factor 38 n=1 Tax=Leptotrombidium deliense TaxID=299467 RepID=A0A443SL24_9ACAR|nr:pre-mRNA-splicing factor 38A-like protein [Leptotrombidium deliense]